MNKKELKIELERIELEEERGYMVVPTGFVLLSHCNPNDILYHFKKKEEIRKRIDKFNSKL